MGKYHLWVNVSGSGTSKFIFDSGDFRKVELMPSGHFYWEKKQKVFISRSQKVIKIKECDKGHFIIDLSLGVYGPRLDLKIINEDVSIGMHISNLPNDGQNIFFSVAKEETKNLYID